MSHRRYRQLFLFLIVLILPSIAIVIAGRTIAKQGTKLADEEFLKRVESERKSKVDAVGHELLSKLDRIKVQEMANAPAGAVPGTASGPNPDVAAIGWVEDSDRLVWSWDREANIQQSEPATENREFSPLRDTAERAEFAKDYDRAADQYRLALAAAAAGRERAAMQLGLARMLWRSGAHPAAVSAFQDLLRLPGDLTDEYGLSFASYAVEPLLDLGADGGLLDLIKKVIASSTALSSMQTLRWKSSLNRLAGSNDATARKAAAAMLERLAAWERDLDEAAALQEDFPKLPVAEENWQAYRPKPEAALWLVGKTPPGASRRPLIIAVRGEMVFAGFRPRFEISDAADAGELLSSQRLPGLRAVLAESDAMPGRAPQTSFWGMSLTLIIILTFLLGFLLWRDAHRDIQIAELRTQFVSSVSHELKTPLTSIRMFAEILQMHGSVDPQMHSEYLETIVNESERLTRLLNNVMDFSRIERGQKTYRLEPAVLADVIQAAVRTIQYPLTEQGFVLALDICETLPQMSVDRDAIQQAVLNLLTNAMKYSGKRRDIELRLAEDKEGAVIEVTDHGIGIPEKEQTHIFEKFYRAQVADNRVISGTGLGLALVAHIAQAHGGSIQVKSKPGEGSTFSLRIPLHPGEGSVRT